MRYTGKAKGIGGVIQQYRAERNMTQRDLAKKSGISVSHINAIENRQRRLTDELRFKIAKALRVSPDNLVESVKSKPLLVTAKRAGKYRLTISGQTTPPFEIDISGDRLRDVMDVGLTAMASLEKVVA